MAADAPRFFNVWLVQPNTVYRGVPYTVVCDWIGEGRLLGRDCVRTPGAPAWEYLDAHALFAPYFLGDGLPRAEDAAEALDPIELEPEAVGKKYVDGDEDVDMIPLIDISMVLLVFFMMTAQDLITSSPFSIPAVQHVEIADRSGNVVISIAAEKDHPERLIYHFTENYTAKYKFDEVISMVEEERRRRGADMKVIVQTSGNMPFERVQHLQIRLNAMGITKVTYKVKAQGGAS
jgi:biopolymer transport protein ExbD